MTNGLREKLYAQSFSQIGPHVLVTAEFSSIFGFDQAIGLDTMRGGLTTAILEREYVFARVALPKVESDNRTFFATARSSEPRRRRTLLALVQALIHEGGLVRIPFQALKGRRAALLSQGFHDED